MKKDEHFSEEQLNAFVDGELDPEEKSRLFNESERSAELDLRMCQQRKLKELVKHAYIDVAPPPKRVVGSQLTQSGIFGTSLVASILLVLGIAGGFFAHNYMDQTRATDVLATTNIENYLLHVTSGEPEMMLAALQEARQILDSAAHGEFRQVEIIANEKGLDLLRTDITPYAEEIMALQKNNVVFYACSKTIERLEEKGVTVRLVPFANPNYTALDRVVKRMQDGWKYEKI
jgi:intracellular sulfur oxidation DsrE/DsrF family protein